jgi:hypothetical protein
MSLTTRDRKHSEQELFVVGVAGNSVENRWDHPLGNDHHQRDDDERTSGRPHDLTHVAAVVTELGHQQHEDHRGDVLKDEERHRDLASRCVCLVATRQPSSGPPLSS